MVNSQLSDRLGVFDVTCRRMKELQSVILLIAICCLALSSCSDSDTGIGPIIPTDPKDTLDNMGGGETRTYSSDIYDVGDWTVEIFIPSDYDSTSRYPVLYFNDGDHFGDIFGILTTLDVDPFIMVGMSGENSRRERFLPYLDQDVANTYGEYVPSAEAYSDAIVNEIMPFVESKYKVLGNKKALFGISFGGLHATWMAIKYPQVFDFIGALSPSYWVANESLFMEDASVLKPPGLSAPTTIYYDRGSVEWRNHLSFAAQLKSEGLEYGKSLFYYEVVGGAHTAEHWLLRLDVPFKLFMEGTPDEPTLLEFRTYCSLDITNNNANTPRANPIVHFENGVRYSVISEADYSVIDGSGSISSDGTYNITSGVSMVVRASYMGVSDEAVLQECN